MVDGYITCIILSAGESKRMGKPKLLLPLGKSTILEQTIDNFLNSKVNEVIVVVGDRADEIASLIAKRPVKVAVNPVYRQGMSTSIATGLSLTSDKARAVMLALADQPFIDTQTINQVIEGFNTHNKGIAIPVYQGRRGHPVIFAIKYKEELSGLKGDTGGRLIFEGEAEKDTGTPVAMGGLTKERVILAWDTCFSAPWHEACRAAPHPRRILPHPYPLPMVQPLTTSHSFNRDPPFQL